MLLPPSTINRRTAFLALSIGADKGAAVLWSERPLVGREDCIKDHGQSDERRQPRHRADVRNTGRVQRHVNQPRDQVQAP